MKIGFNGSADILLGKFWLVGCYPSRTTACSAISAKGKLKAFVKANGKREGLRVNFSLTWQKLPKDTVLA